MATAGKQWVVWFSDPNNPGWDFWGTSKTAEAAKQDAEDAKKKYGYQTLVQGPVDFPELQRAKPR